MFKIHAISLKRIAHLEFGMRAMRTSCACESAATFCTLTVLAACPAACCRLRIAASRGSNRCNNASLAGSPGSSKTT